MPQKTQNIKNYIVFDLEWNQCAEGKTGEIPGLPFEIIEIGAVKLNEDFEVISEFSRIVRPKVYQRLHFKVLEILDIGMEELTRRGEPFDQVIHAFFSWCREADGETIFCTWGNMDLTELQRNMAYYGVDNPFPNPLFYYDVQKLYSRLYRDNGKDKPTLEHAVQEQSLEVQRPFHRAIEDAKYTGAVLRQMDFPSVAPYLSLDYYRIPDCKEHEISLTFPDYSKYVSRGFASREELIRDKEVNDLCCFACRRMLRKKIGWFTGNQRNYLALGICPEHGLMRGKLRVRKSEEGRYYCVKTVRMTDEAGAEELIRQKEAHAGKQREKLCLKRRREKLRRPGGAIVSKEAPS